MQCLSFLKRLETALVVIMSLSLYEGKSFAAKCPCDIYKDGATPCVAAHSTVRALYSSYDGPLYQVRRTADNQLKDINVMAAGGYANAAAQDSFLNGKAGTISKIYDQSANGNHLTKAQGGSAFPAVCLEANATAAKIKVNGYNVYGVYTTGAWEPNPGTGYRNNAGKGVTTGNNAEGMYMVCGGKHYNGLCCFDYGNAQTNIVAKGPATMESLYFGNSTQWGHGSGSGPWIMNDCEYGIQAGVDPNGTKGIWNGNTPIVADYVTGTLKSKNDTNFWALRGGDAVTGKLKTLYSGRQYPGYYPKILEGAIVLGVGGDNSHTGEGTFFEGAMTNACPTDSIEDLVQANIVAAGYGRTTTSIAYEPAVQSHEKATLNVNYNPQNGSSILSLDLPRSVVQGELKVCLFDLTGRLAAIPFKGRTASSRLTLTLNAKEIRSGAYFVKVSLDNKTALTKTITLW